MDPYAALGVSRDATPDQVTAAYRALVRALHPDRTPADPGRLAEVIEAYRALREMPAPQAPGRDQPAATRIPVRVHRPERPDLWAGPVRRHGTV